MMKGFTVLNPGMQTTVQDLGRTGYQAYGMPVAGAVDSFAFRAGNLLLGNEEGAAGLEMVMMGPKLRIERELAIAITGANMSPLLNGQPLPMWECVMVSAGDEISFQSPESGLRSYLLVAGGLDVPLVMGSRSTYLRAGIGGLDGRKLAKGDTLKVGVEDVPAHLRSGNGVPQNLIPAYEQEATVRVVMGPQDDHFTEKGRRTFLTETYRVTQEIDRMGYRLEGPKIEHREGADIISDGIPLGAIQIPGHGSPIVMLNDRQTTGGYPKIAAVISTDLYRVGQAKPGDRLTFQAISRSEAVARLREQEKGLQKLSQLHKSRGKRPMTQRHLRLTIRGISYSVTVEEGDK